MQVKPRKLISWQMVVFEFRCVIGNPYVHIFGVGLPILLAMMVSRAAVSELPDDSFIPMTETTIYLGLGSLIPMATILMGYAVGYAQELEKGIPQRLELFGIRKSIALCNRMISEIFFMLVAFALFFGSGCIFAEFKAPELSGLISYCVCILAFSIICLGIAHAVACLCRRFGLTYCVSMLTYFLFMILGGMMGITYDDLPKWAQMLSRLLPVTYFNQDFYRIWCGEEYNYMPMLQSYLFLGAVAAILLFIAFKRPERQKKG